MDKPKPPAPIANRFREVRRVPIVHNVLPIVGQVPAGQTVELEPPRELYGDLLWRVEAVVWMPQNILPRTTARQLAYRRNWVLEAITIGGKYAQAPHRLGKGCAEGRQPVERDAWPLIDRTHPLAVRVSSQTGVGIVALVECAVYSRDDVVPRGVEPLLGEL